MANIHNKWNDINNTTSQLQNKDEKENFFLPHQNLLTNELNTKG